MRLDLLQIYSEGRLKSNHGRLFTRMLEIGTLFFRRILIYNSEQWFFNNTSITYEYNIIIVLNNINNSKI